MPLEWQSHFVYNLIGFLISIQYLKSDSTIGHILHSSQIANSPVQCFGFNSKKRCFGPYRGMNIAPISNSFSGNSTGTHCWNKIQYTKQPKFWRTFTVKFIMRKCGENYPYTLYNYTCIYPKPYYFEIQIMLWNNSFTILTVTENVENRENTDKFYEWTQWKVINI